MASVKPNLSRENAPDEPVSRSEMNVKTAAETQHVQDEAADALSNLEQAGAATLSGCGVEVAALLELQEADPEALSSQQQELQQHVKTCAQCQHTLEAVAALDAISNDFFQADASNVTSGWINDLVKSIPIEARAGRLVPLNVSRERVLGYQTEGALRSLVRRCAAGPDLLVTRVKFEGDVEAATAEITVNVRIAVRYGAVINDVVNAARTQIYEALNAHTDLQINAVNIEVVDILAGVKVIEGEA